MCFLVDMHLYKCKIWLRWRLSPFVYSEQLWIAEPTLMVNCCFLCLFPPFLHCVLELNYHSFFGVIYLHVFVNSIPINTQDTLPDNSIWSVFFIQVMPGVPIQACGMSVCSLNLRFVWGELNIMIMLLSFSPCCLQHAVFSDTQIPGSNRAVDKRLFSRKSLIHCDTWLWARAAHLLQCPGRLSLPPSAPPPKWPILCRVGR